MSEAEIAKESDLIHRLKNHLCIIVGFCELLLEDAAGDEKRSSDLHEIQRAAQNMVSMLPEVASRLR